MAVLSKVVLVGSAAFAGVFLAGCGGGDDDPAPAPSSDDGDSDGDSTPGPAPAPVVYTNCQAVTTAEELATAMATEGDTCSVCIMEKADSHLTPLLTGPQQMTIFMVIAGPHLAKLLPVATADDPAAAAAQIFADEPTLLTDLVGNLIGDDANGESCQVCVQKEMFKPCELDQAVYSAGYQITIQNILGMD